MKGKFLMIVLLLTQITLVAQNSIHSGWNNDLTIEHEGIKRYFRVYVPKAKKEKASVVVLFHPEGENMTSIFKWNTRTSRTWKKLADKGGFVLIVPNGMNQQTNKPNGKSQYWNDCAYNDKEILKSSSADDVGFVVKAVDYTINNVKVNPKKIYVSGVSNGGMMAMRMAIETDKFAAVSCFFTNLPEESECVGKPEKTPVFLMNATRDSIVPYLGGKNKKNRKEYLSSQRTIEYWFLTNGFYGHNPNKIRTNNSNKRDSSHIVMKRYGLPKSRSHIEYYTIVKGDHHVPSKKDKFLFILGFYRKRNRDVEANKLAWEFMKQFKK